MMLVSSLSNICNVFSFIFLAPFTMFTLFLHRKNIKVYYCCRWHARAKERVNTQALKIERENGVACKDPDPNRKRGRCCLYRIRIRIEREDGVACKDPDPNRK